MIKPFIETELKFEINAEQIVWIRTNPKISFSKEVYQLTTMYDNSSYLMGNTGGRLRLRVQGTDYSLSYKKKLPSKGTEKNEIEFETNIENIIAMRNILEMLGYIPTTSYEKYVETAKTKDDVIIEIQRYPFATFLEIEGLKDKIEKVAKDLNLDLSVATNKPIDTLFCEWREKMKLPFKPYMRFSDYDK